ncbi:glycosyltransferase [Hydrogenophaga sp.]|uniref:glycosyltransferase n=1 Tax=Hydrogenophaga sp. TaxID=1904254 RepID=UPI0026059A1F|nr:glycosyltransferase [Hydrogenophaga sp.]
MIKPNLVVFSHLRWSFVHQRPQHLLSRLAQHWSITFIEEPLMCEGLPFLQESHTEESITVVVPRTPLTDPGFHENQVEVLQPLIQGWLARQGIDHPVVWLYTPMALPLARVLDPVCMVYDCMDELSAFKDAPRRLWQHERALMQEAALVLTGGPSLFEARRRLNPNVHCIPSSVDAAHFSPSRLDCSSQAAQDVQALQGHIGGPKLGFFGVIDERMDVALMTHLADAQPLWQIVMVGPVVKIDPATLPRQGNIHWLGMQDYQRLPYFLAGWDVCLMPFALNEATRFISPTKTLEYMAGGKPVVSTAVNDVVSMYGMAVEVAYAYSGFVRACERLLAASDTAREVRSREMASLVAAGSWERSASKVNTLLCEARDMALRCPFSARRLPVPQGELPLEMTPDPVSTPW